MKTMHPLTSKELLWKQPKFGVDHFELYQEDRLVAELYWTKLLSEAAIARTAAGWWTFDRPGWLRDRVVATITNTERVAATVDFDWLKDGSIVLADGRTFSWYRTKVFGSAWALVESGNAGYFEIEHGYHWFKQRLWIDLHFPLTDPDLPLLLCLAVYLIYCILQDAAAAVAATSAVSAVV